MFRFFTLFRCERKLRWGPRVSEKTSKDAHRLQSQAAIPVGEDDPDEIAEQLFEGLEANVED